MVPTSNNEYQHSTLFSPPYRRRLHQALLEVDGRIANHYLGVLLSLSQPENPLRFAGAGVGVREIMQQLAYYKGLPRSEDLGTLGTKARKLQEAWTKVCKSSHCRSVDGWNGEIDDSLHTFFDSAEDFFSWYSSERPKNSERHTAMLRSFDLSGLQLPTLIEDRRVKRWTELLGYFNGAVHLTSNTEVFDDRLSALEIFLLDLLKPQTFDDQDEIDAIIREGEAND